MSKSIPYTILTLVKSGYNPLNGTCFNKNGLPYFCVHNISKKIICLNGDNRTYRPMGELQQVNLNEGDE